MACAAASAQGPELIRPGPPAVDRLEVDEDGDGVPDGWYNLRDARHAEGGPGGSGRMLKFECEWPSRPARASRAFGVDGRKVEALVVGLWARAENLAEGERAGEAPALMIDLLGEDVRALSRGVMGPWTRTVGAEWTYLRRRIAVPPGTRDAILTVGLLGATGTLEIDDLAIDPVPRAARSSTNLILNGDFSLGDPAPTAWSVEGATRRRTAIGGEPDPAMVLSGRGAKALTALSVAGPVGRLGELSVALRASGSGVKGGGAQAVVYYLDADGRPLPGTAASTRALRWAGRFAERAEQATVAVPREAEVAVFQVEKLDADGTIEIDDVVVTAAAAPSVARWSPWQVEAAEGADSWPAFAAAGAIEPGSALDYSFLLTPPAGRAGPVVVRDGRLAFADGRAARFFGAAIVPPLAYADADAAEALADRLARSGVNLARLGALDTPLGPGLGLFEDTRDDTKEPDLLALERLDGLIDALKRRGIFVAVEVQASRRFRSGDGVADHRTLPPGGGPASAFDPVLRDRAREAAAILLGHVNSKTGLALRDDPALAWVALAGELSLFDLIDDPTVLGPDRLEALRAAARPGGGGRRGWSLVEGAQWKALAESLRSDGLKAPIAGSSHWRGEPEFVAAQAGAGLDLIDGRLYWSPPAFAVPERRGLPWFPSDGGLAGEGRRKRKAGKPFVVGEWCGRTGGAWAAESAGADLIVAAATAADEGWDALVRRGVATHPADWGSAAPGTGGGDDLRALPEILNASPPAFAMMPHAASIYLRGTGPSTHGRARATPVVAARRRGVVVVDTPYTQGVAGRPGRGEVATGDLTIAVESDHPTAVVMASSAGPEPIAKAGRLLVTVAARAAPTGFRWADLSHRVVADPGRPPVRVEPVRATIAWRGPGREALRAFALDAAGRRVAEAPVERSAGGSRVRLEGPPGTMHWELSAGVGADSAGDDRPPGRN